MRSDYEFCQLEREDQLLIVTLNRPEVRNALHAPAHQELDQIWREFDEDPDLWVAIITGAGEQSFSAGNDLKHQALGGDMSIPKSGFAGLSHRSSLNKPLIAAVNGTALGGGFEIALCCDLIIASDTATFGLPEPRVGLAALAGGLQRLTRNIGYSRAIEMILTARHVNAEEGVQLGFVHRVVRTDLLMQEARDVAEQMLSLSPLALRAAKEAVLLSLSEPNLEEALLKQFEYPAMKALLKSEDFAEGPRAFVEKRAPKWSGR